MIMEKRKRDLSKVKIAGISDEYQPDEDKLVELVKYWAKKEGLI